MHPWSSRLPRHGSSLRRINAEYIGRMGIGFHYCKIGPIAIIMRPYEIRIKDAADDALIAYEGNAITGPVIGIDMCGTDMQEIIDQRFLLLVGDIVGRNFTKSVNSPYQQQGANHQEYSTSSNHFDICKAF